MAALNAGLDTSTHDGLVASLITDAYDADTLETQRHRFTDGDIAEVRVKEAPLYGIRIELDVELDEEQVPEVVPGDISNSVVEEEMAQLIDAKEDTTRISDALDDETFDWFVREIAAGKDADREMRTAEDETTEAAVRETLMDLGICTQLFASEDHHVATFFAYV